MDGDFGVSPFFDRGYFCNPGCTQIANGGASADEYLADRNNNYTLSFTTVGTSCLLPGLGHEVPGRDPAVRQGGVLGRGLLWTYWNGTS